MTKQFYRQGDVGLVRLTELPEDAIKQSVNKRIVLAFGEVTGHAHTISTDEASLYEWHGNQLVVVDKQGASLTHEEHATITLAPGVYRKIQQREYTPTQIRRVSD